jgi:hypothetical protein
MVIVDPTTTPRLALLAICSSATAPCTHAGEVLVGFLPTF